MDTQILQERAQRVEEAYRLLQGNKDNLGNIPGILRQIITLRVWEGYDWQGKTVTFSTFREFVETPPPEGLGTTIGDLVQFCRKYPEIADLIDSVVQEQTPSYRPPKRGNNVTPSKKAKGNSLQRSLRTLRNYAAENSQAAKLREKVLAGQISANQALIQLGKREKKFNIKASPDAVAGFARKHLSDEQIKELIDTLG